MTGSVTICVVALWPGAKDNISSLYFLHNKFLTPFESPMDYKLTKFAYIPLFLDTKARTMISPNSTF